MNETETNRNYKKQPNQTQSEQKLRGVGWICPVPSKIHLYRIHKIIHLRKISASKNQN